MEKYISRNPSDFGSDDQITVVHDEGGRDHTIVCIGGDILKELDYLTDQVRIALSDGIEVPPIDCKNTVIHVGSVGYPKIVATDEVTPQDA